MKKILFITNIPSPYRVDFYNLLSEQVDLTVIFEARRAHGINFNWNDDKIKFKAIFLSEGEIKEKHVYSSISKYLKKDFFDRIIVTNYSDFTGIYSILKLKQRKISYIIEGDGALKNNSKGIKEKIKKWIISGAHMCFSTSKSHDDYYESYGVAKEKIVRYPFTSLFRSDISDNVVSLKEKKSIREKLGIKEDFVVITVGRFSYLNGYGKGYDVIMKSANKLSKQIGFYIVGGKPTEEFALWKEKEKLDNVHFVDFKCKKDLNEYYKASDVFVLMTIGDVWGLVINEAMACGLPIITTDKCVAGLELVKNDENGYVLPVGDDEGLSNKVNYLFNNKEIIAKMGKNNIDKIKDYTIEKMSQKHIEVMKLV